MRLASQTNYFSYSVLQGDGYVIDLQTAFYSSGTLASSLMQLNTCIVTFRGRDETRKTLKGRPNDR